MTTALTRQESAEALRQSRCTAWRKEIATVADLPVEAQRAWATDAQRKPIEITESPGQLALRLTVPIGPNLSQKDREEAEHRYQAIAPLIERENYRGFWMEAGGGRSEVLDTLARQHGIGTRTIQRWVRAFEAGGLPGLVRRDRADKGQPRTLDKTALDFLLAAALPKPGEYGELSAREIFRAYQEERVWRAEHLAEPTLQLPPASYRTLCEWLGRIPEVLKIMARQGEEAYAASQEIISSRNLSAVQPLDYLVMDHRRLDVFAMVRVINGKPGWRLVRPWLTAALDMRTRKWMAWCVVEQPSSDSIASVLRQTLMQWGVPQAVYWDNGKDFCCHWLEGRAERTGPGKPVGELGTGMRGVLETLGIRVHHAIVKRARSKIIEANFLATALFDRTLPWWCGHIPSARPERFDRLVEQHESWMKGDRLEPAFPTIERVAQIYDVFLGELNERPHQGDGMGKITPTGRGWMVPNEAWELLIRRVRRRPVAPEVIQFAFAKRKRLTVRQGELRMSFGGRDYHYRLIAAPIALMAYNGREVEIAYDPHELGTCAIYAEDRLLGIAENVELRKMGEKDFVEDEKNRRAARRQVKKFIAAVHGAVHVPGPVERLERIRLAGGDGQPAALEIMQPAAAIDAGDDGRFEFFQGGKSDGGGITGSSE